MKLSLISVAALMIGCSHVQPAPKLPDPPPVVATVAQGYKLVITVDGVHCRETVHQPEDSMMVSLICTDGNQGYIGVLLTLMDWAVLRK